MTRLSKILRVSWTAKKTNELVLNKAGVKRELIDTIRARKTSLLWSHHEETRELPGERDNARNNARCTQVRKTTHACIVTTAVLLKSRRWPIVSRTLQSCGGPYLPMPPELTLSPKRTPFLWSINSFLKTSPEPNLSRRSYFP